ncbi:class I SAM-dependent methyltransferase [Pseudoflavonifractor sp. 524-17]|uniref:class I SAM-dependent methyltransferase n=1 Tax=Pseudoflavonifractor sp. 524-17 TaxID=2304577 RepID=UPI0013795DAE|nr:class I SAM-dependent methyltransferase [Pseudoflavonifractor sp. 524-17]
MGQRKEQRRPFNRDVEYWNDFYKNKFFMSEPTAFARTILPYLKPGKKLIDVGCGNGRDSLFFYQSGINVLGIDASDVAIGQLQGKAKEGKLSFLCGDFTRQPDEAETYDYCYSRFTLHAISQEQSDLLFQHAARILKDGGVIWIEARSVHDDLYGQGIPLGKNEFLFDGHYRRFIEKKGLKKELEKAGFSVVYMEESRDFAPFQNERPAIIRAVGVKKGNRRTGGQGNGDEI